MQLVNIKNYVDHAVKTGKVFKAGVPETVTDDVGEHLLAQKVRKHHREVSIFERLDEPADPAPQPASSRPAPRARARPTSRTVSDTDKPGERTLSGTVEMKASGLTGEKNNE